MVLSEFSALAGSHKFGLIVGPDPKTRELMSCISYLALKGPVRVLDAGNHFDLFEVTYKIRRATNQLYAVAERVTVVRAFTCIEVCRALREMTSVSPVIIIDLLATFYDEAVSDQRSSVLVDDCIREILRLKVTAPVIASLTTGLPKASKRRNLINKFIEAADLVEYPQIDKTLPELRLF